MKHASIIFRRHRNNTIFEGNEGANFGGWYFPFHRLREGFRAVGIELSTIDMNAGREVLFEIHINVQRRRSKVPMYCYLYEHPHVRGINGSVSLLARYRQVYTWNEAFIDERLIHRLEIPNDLTPRPMPTFDQRDIFCAMIAKNKEMRRPSDISLYQERLRLIRGFEQHAPELFSLYGKAWDIPPVGPGFASRIVKLYQQWRHRRSATRPFPSWRGTVASKDDVLQHAKFSLCYENLRGGKGYLTEKLFDAIANGCLPVYAGASDIDARVPRECYIDGTQFPDVPALIDHLKAIHATEFAARQSAMQAFMRSAAGLHHDQDHFCRTLQDGILRDLGLLPAATVINEQVQDPRANGQSMRPRAMRADAPPVWSAAMYVTVRRALRTLKRKLRTTHDAAFLPSLRGVVHVGANSGQERGLYDSYRLPVLWIEPIPEVFETLQKNIASYPGQQAVQALVAATDGVEVDFHIASNDGASSSMLELAKHKDIWPTVGYNRSVRMTTRTLPSVVAAAGIDMARYNGLIMDTQGSELLVLQGAIALLQHFDFVKTEVADFESYKGCCQLHDLGPFMDKHGFDEFARHRFRKLEPGKAYYDVVYRRR